MIVQKLTIKDWAFEDRPREKLINQGKRMMSNAELLAILIGSGSRDESAVELSMRILHCLNNDIDKLAGLSVEELSRFKGIGEAKAVTILAALEFCDRRHLKNQDESVKISSSKNIYDLMSRYFKGLKHEECWMVLVNSRNRVILKHQLSKGRQAGTAVDPKILFQIALERHAAAVVLCHNHPSGLLSPSKEDIRLTQNLAEAGKMLGVGVYDHLIFSDSAYLSFADEGIMPA